MRWKWIWLRRERLDEKIRSEKLEIRKKFEGEKIESSNNILISNFSISSFELFSDF